MQVYILEADLMGRTIAFKNQDDQLVAIAAKSTKALIMSQVRGLRFQPAIASIDRGSCSSRRCGTATLSGRLL